MLGAVAGRGEQGEDQINGPVVDRAVGHGRVETDENGRHAVDALDPGVRHGDAGAQAGRAEGFTLEQGLHDAGLREAERLGARFRHRMQRLAFRRRTTAQDDTALRQQFPDVHKLSRLYPNIPGGRAPCRRPASLWEAL